MVLQKKKQQQQQHTANKCSVRQTATLEKKKWSRSAKMQCVPSPSQPAEARKRVSKMCIAMRWLRNFRAHTYSPLTPSCAHGIALLPSLSQITRERRALLLKLMPRAKVSLIFSLAQTGPPIHRAIMEHGWEDVHLRGTLFCWYVYKTTLKVFSPGLPLRRAHILSSRSNKYYDDNNWKRGASMQNPSNHLLYSKGGGKYP